MSKLFNPVVGYYWAESSVVECQQGPIALVTGGPVIAAHSTAMLLAGAPEMFEMLVRAHNAMTSQPNMQASIRGTLVKVVGSAEALREYAGHSLIGWDNG